MHTVILLDLYMYDMATYTTVQNWFNDAEVQVSEHELYNAFLHDLSSSAYDRFK